MTTPQQPQQYPYGNDFDPEDVHARYGVVDGVNQDQGYMPGEIAYLDTDTPGSGRAGPGVLARDVFAEHPDEFYTAGDGVLSDAGAVWRGGLVVFSQLGNPPGGIYPARFVVGPNPARRRLIIANTFGLSASLYVFVSPAPVNGQSIGGNTFALTYPYVLGQPGVLLGTGNTSATTLEMFHTGPVYAAPFGNANTNACGFSWFEETYAQRPDRSYVG